MFFGQKRNPISKRRKCDYYVHVPFEVRKNWKKILKFINYLVIVKM